LCAGVPTYNTRVQVFERFKSDIGALTFTNNHDRKCISKVYNKIPVIDKGRLLIL